MIGHKVPYRCAKFERNRSTGRVFVFGWLKVTFVKRYEEDEENRAIFRNIYLANYLADLLQIWYVGSRIWRA